MQEQIADPVFWFLAVGFTLLLRVFAGAVYRLVKGTPASQAPDPTWMMFGGVALVLIGILGAARAKSGVPIESESACVVMVEGRTYHPYRVYISQGVGTMYLSDGREIRFLGGTIEGCR